MSTWGSNADLNSLLLPCICKGGVHDRIQGTVESGDRKGESKATVSGEYPTELCKAIAAKVASGTRSAAC